MPVSGWLASM